jgi:outer membrane scaffolding protein for murein synthesis (MipA/OmpV family)
MSMAIESSRFQLYFIGRFAFFLLLGVMFAGESGYAQSRKSTPAAASTGMPNFVSLGLAYVPDHEGSNEYKFYPLFAMRYNFGSYYVEWIGLEGRANMLAMPHFEFGPAMSVDLARNNKVDDSVIGKMTEIETMFRIGAFAKVRATGIVNQTDEIAFTVKVLTDVSNKQGGYLVSLGPSYSISLLPRLWMSVGAGVTYANKEYMSTYFGVNAVDAEHSGLGAYRAGDGFKDINFTMQANFLIDEKWGVFGVASCKNLLGDAAASPIVMSRGRKNSCMASAGLTYAF